MLAADPFEFSVGSVFVPLVSAIIGGGLTWYLTSRTTQNEKRADEKRKRESIATALMMEINWLLPLFQRQKERNGIVFNLFSPPTVILHLFASHVELFDKTTVYAVQDFRTSVLTVISRVKEGNERFRYNVTLADTTGQSRADNEYLLQGISEGVKAEAAIAIERGELAYEKLRTEGGVPVES